MILPGGTLGVLGGGQLGRMFTAAALRMGYRVVVFDPDQHSPAGLIASYHICAPFDDIQALDELIELCQAVTIEFENIPLTSLQYVESKVPLSPNSAAIGIAQNRIKEKTFFQKNQIATADFCPVTQEDDIENAVETAGLPCILKTAQFGYDGKGQVICVDRGAVKEAFNKLGQVDCILEKKVDLQLEISVILVCQKDGAIEAYPVAQNEHTDGILDTTIVPAQISEEQKGQAVALAKKLASCLHYNGVIAIELFVSQTGELLVNEIAPRPHNSGHYTQDATDSCQFEQQVRMMCELPVASTTLNRQVAMLNLLGDLWGDSEPHWKEVFKLKGAKLHLYAKNEARKGRKMGHINIIGSDAIPLLSKSRKLKNLLAR